MNDLDKLLGFLTQLYGKYQKLIAYYSLTLDPAAKAYPPSPKAIAAAAKFGASPELVPGSHSI